MLCRSSVFAVFAAVLCTVAVAQTPAPPAPPLLSPRAMAEVALSGASVSIDYGAPSARGRVIFGGLVPFGQVWRTGANAATTLKTTGDLKIGTLTVPAGTYTIYSVPAQDGGMLIVNKQIGQWGTVYDQTQDLGRTALTYQPAPSPVETFVIDFEKTSGASTELHFKWAGADVSVPVSAVK